MARERYLLNDDEEPINRPGAEITLKTKKDKWDNFWFYHRTHVIVGVILALLAAYFIYDMATKTSPDYNVAVLSSAYVSTDAGNLLAEEMEKYGEDLNGDGQVIVQVNIFQVAQGDDMDTADPQMQMASVVKFQGDVQMGESYIYLIDDLNFLAYGAEAGLFKNLDGTVPVEGEEIDPEKMRLSMEDCKGLADTEIGQAFSAYQFTLRDIRDDLVEENPDYYAGQQRLFDALVSGTKPGSADASSEADASEAS